MPRVGFEPRNGLRIGKSSTSSSFSILDTYTTSKIDQF